jgi:molecular chaperone DnaK
VHVLQGERPLARDNRTLGRFQLVGIPPAPRGAPQIEVTFDIDANGIVSVSAKDLASGKEQKVTITASSGLTKAEIDRLVKDAESHAAEDQKRRELVEARNEADALAYTVERAMNEAGDRVPPVERSRVDEAVADVRRVMAGEDLQAIRQSVDALRRAADAIGEHMKQERPARDTAAPRSSPQEGEVIDAETVETHDGR